MNGITIFNHSARQVLGNLGMAVKVSWWLIVLIVLIIGAAMFYLGDYAQYLALDPNSIDARNLPDLPFTSGQIATAFLSGIAFFVLVLWSISVIAIAWHRYILTEEMPKGIIPYNSSFPVGRYFWVGFGISLITLIAASILGGILLMILGPSMAGSVETGGALVTGLLIALVTGIVVTVLYLRMALVLPGIALDDKLTIGGAWEASSGYAGAIAIVAIMLTVLNVVAGVVIEFISGMGLPELLVSLLDLGFNWFYFMLNISVLSTLYGHLVQKREVY